MRSTDAIPGETYRLRKRAQIEVEMLDTPPEVRAIHRMRVKFLSGVKAGTTSDIPSVAIAPRTQPDNSQVNSQRPRQSARGLVPASGPLQPGTTVIVDDDKVGFQWKVKQLLPDGRVEITTTIFEKPTATTVSSDRVRLLDQRRRPVSERVSTENPEARGANHFDQTAWVSKNLSPVRPRRHLDVVADSLLLGPRCLHSCRDRFYPDVSLAECADRFRSEIRTRGTIQRDRTRGRLEGRIRVPRRFDVILPDEFSPGIASTIDDPAVILDLRPRPKARKRRPSTKNDRNDKRARGRRRHKRRPPSD